MPESECKNHVTRPSEAAPFCIRTSAAVVRTWSDALGICDFTRHHYRNLNPSLTSFLTEYISREPIHLGDLSVTFIAVWVLQYIVSKVARQERSVAGAEMDYEPMNLDGSDTGPAVTIRDVGTSVQHHEDFTDGAYRPQTTA